MRVVLPDPTHYVHAHAFDEITLALLGGFKRLGFDVEVTRQCSQGRARVLVLAPHLQDLDALRRLDPDSILYTWEPRGWSHVVFMTPELTATMRDFVVWDYSRKNVATWGSEGASRVAHVPLGYDRFSNVCLPGVNRTSTCSSTGRSPNAAQRSWMSW